MGTVVLIQYGQQQEGVQDTGPVAKRAVTLKRGHSCLAWSSLVRASLSTQGQVGWGQQWRTPPGYPICYHLVGCRGTGQGCPVCILDGERKRHSSPPAWLGGSPEGAGGSQGTCLPQIEGEVGGH